MPLLLLRLCFVSRFLGVLALILNFATAPAWGQAPGFGPTVAVGTFVGEGRSDVSETAIDAAGNVYVTGTFSGTVSFGNFTLISEGGSDMFVAKLTSAGNYLWVVQAGGGGYDSGGGLAVDASGSAYVAGTFSSFTAAFGSHSIVNSDTRLANADIFVARLDTNGNWLWARQAGSNNFDGGSSLVLDAAGNAYITGGFTGFTAVFGSHSITKIASNNTGVYDLFIAKINAQGTWQWARSGGGQGQDGGTALAIDASSNVYLTGLVQSTPGRFGPFSVSIDNQSIDDILVAKLDTDGNWLWATRAGGSGIDQGHGIAVDALGNAYVTGTFRSRTARFGSITLTNAGATDPLTTANDVFVAKLDAAGAWQWAVQAGGTSSNGSGDAGNAIALTTSELLTVVGSFSSATARFGSFSLNNTSQPPSPDVNWQVYADDAFIAQLSTSGEWLGVVGSQGEGEEAAHSVAVGAFGRVSVAGSFKSTTAAFGATSLPGSIIYSRGYVTLPALKPIISSYAPSSGAPGQAVSVKGTGFVGVTEVLFNDIPAAAFTVQSPTQLEAIVPSGVTSGPISVRTSAGTGNSNLLFNAAVVLATSAPTEVGLLQLWPNPIRAYETLHLQLSDKTSPTTITQVEVRNSLGQLVQQSRFHGRAVSLELQNLPPGVYQLSLVTAQQPLSRQRLVVN